MNFNAAQLAVLVKENFASEFYRTFVRNFFFLRFIEAMGSKQQFAEKDVTWKLQIAGTPGAGSYSEHGSIGINRTDLGPRFETAQLNWKLHDVPIVVSGLSQAISQSQSSIVEATAVATQDALAELQKNINLQCLADGNGNLNGVHSELNAGSDLVGVQAFWDDGGSVPIYAGIDRSAAPWWRSFVLRNSTGTPRAITEELIFQITNEVQGVRGFPINTVTCSQGVHTQFGMLLSGDRNYNFSGNDLPSYVAGFDVVKFKELLVVKIPLYERGRMDFWDSSQLAFKVLMDLQIDPRDAGDQDAIKLFARTYNCLQYRNPFSAGSIRDLIE